MKSYQRTYKRKARIKNAEDMLDPTDPLGEFDIEDIIKLADSGDTKGYSKQLEDLTWQLQIQKL